jgi:hypothetical protein
LFKGSRDDNKMIGSNAISAKSKTTAAVMIALAMLEKN